MTELINKGLINKFYLLFVSYVQVQLKEIIPVFGEVCFFGAKMYIC